MAESSAPSKRPRLRTVGGGTSGTGGEPTSAALSLALRNTVTVRGEFLQDFCRAFLQDEELELELRKLVKCKKNPVAPSNGDDQQEADQVSKDLPTVPLQFESAKEYMNIFQTLMVEEAKAELFINLKENIRRVGFDLTSKGSDERDDDSCPAAYTAGKTTTVHCKLRANVRLPERHKRDWKEAEAEQIKRIQSDARATPCGLSKLQRGDVLILLHSHMARRSAGYYETESRFAAFGVVSRPARPYPPSQGDVGGVELDVAVTSSVAPQLRSLPLSVYLVDGCNLVTSWREWDGMNSLLSERQTFSGAWSSSLVPFLLSGGKPAVGGTPRSGVSSSSSTAATDPQARTDLIELSNVANVDPNLPLTLPGATPLYQQTLMKNYNMSQMEAIAAASSATAGFVLVQGPPGTGKTHTLLALLNSLHLSVCQQCYEQDLPDPFKGSNVTPNITRFDWLRDKSNPHLLVVAPSNAAIDNVLRLVITKGFLDGQGNRYHPKCVRIGSSNWNNARSQGDIFSAQSLEMQVDALMRMRGYADARAQSETDQLISRLKGRESELRMLSRRLVETANEHAASRSPEKLAEFHGLAAAWVENRNIARDIALDLERRRLLFSQSGGDAGLRADMRALILTQANLVFATLSQCGSSAMTEIAPSRIRFHVCVVDEAAQAVEPSTLVPLSLGVERCVMVGDPNQLPATVISEKATRARYQQSLFERLQRCGHAVHLLNTQYRCRPELSSFCSQTFYGGRLRDGENVQNPSYALPLYRFPCFGPLVFFDVAFGSQVRSSSTSSLSNDAEAEVCLELYLTLRDQRVVNDSISPLTGKPCHIAIISPYREQLSLLQSRFLAHSQRDPLLEMNTVDGFQGREVDIVIFSCVRAHTSTSVEDETADGGIGFLNDARRLNVAETRARFSFLVVGNRDVLRRGSRLWRGLLDHVQKRGRMVQVPQGKFDYLRSASPVQDIAPA